jgi:hypothetical protein
VGAVASPGRARRRSRTVWRPLRERNPAVVNCWTSAAGVVLGAYAGNSPHRCTSVTSCGSGRSSVRPTHRAPVKT